MTREATILSPRTTSTSIHYPTLPLYPTPFYYIISIFYSYKCSIHRHPLPRMISFTYPACSMVTLYLPHLSPLLLIIFPISLCIYSFLHLTLHLKLRQSSANNLPLLTPLYRHLFLYLSPRMTSFSTPVWSMVTSLITPPEDPSLAMA